MCYPFKQCTYLAELSETSKDLLSDIGRSVSIWQCLAQLGLPVSLDNYIFSLSIWTIYCSGFTCQFEQSTAQVLLVNFTILTPKVQYRRIFNKLIIWVIWSAFLLLCSFAYQNINVQLHHPCRFTRKAISSITLRLKEHHLGCFKLSSYSLLQ